jgi:glucose-6-phosphate-specific signal transduction histidine kinase
MLKARGMPNWVQHVAIALGYAASYYLLRQISVSHFQLFSGLRLFLLLVVPYRFWPALAVGETIPLAELAIECGPLYGWDWALVRVIAPILPSFAIVHWFRERWPRMADKFSDQMAPWLLCVMVVSITWCACNLAVFAMTKMPADYVVPPYHVVAGRYFVGHCVGILMLTPLLLWGREVVHKGTWRLLPQQLVSNTKTLESIAVLIPSLGFLTWLAIKNDNDLGQIARMAMFLPVAMLTLRHGWRGAAIGTAVASTCIIIAMPHIHDLTTVTAHTFISLTSSILLLLGSRISALHAREKQERIDERRAMQMAQQSILLSERRLHTAAEALEDIRDIMAVSQEYMLDRFQRLLSPDEQRGYRRTAAQTQAQLYQLASGLSPRIQREQDLPVTLSSGALARALDEAGVAYSCEVQNQIPGQMGPMLPIALYRLACEASLLLCTHYQSTRIQLRLRVGLTGERVWAMLMIDGREASNEPVIRSNMLQRNLGAGGMDLAMLRNQAKVYGGNLRMRTSAEGARITMLLTDTEAA